MKKITFVGDIMCEEPLQKACRHGAKYSFDRVFEGCKKLFSESDYVIGNLETVFAGKEAGYTKQLFSFNTPDEFAEALGRSGINMVTTAQNHILDRDRAGLLRTLQVLDQVGVEHIGTYASEEERNEVFIKDFDGCKVAFLNYVQSTNLDDSPYVLDETEYYLVNLLMPQFFLGQQENLSVRQKILKIVKKLISIRRYLELRRFFHLSYVNKFTDSLDENNLREEYLERIRSDMKKARAVADLVVVCLHMGGQFNETPGERAAYFTRLFADLGADYIINTHPHVVQRSDRTGRTFAAYCLGNFSLSPNSVYVPAELKPEYSIALHLYIDGKSSQKIAFSVLKILENRKHELEVLPVDELYQRLESAEEQEKLMQDLRFIYSRFTGREDPGLSVRREYVLEK